MQITQLIIYPVKSLQGIPLESAQLEKRGLQYDRRWMLTDLNGKFISQRTHPILALIKVAILNQNLHFTFLDEPQATLEIPAFPLQNEPLLEVSVFDNKCKAASVSQKANKWFSKILGIKCRLVYMPEESKRLVSSKYGGPTDIVSFADGYPLLLIGEASLNKLNEKLKVPVSMDRFRPNIVINGEEAYGEDSWLKFKVNDLLFRAVKPCSRCIIPTIDQAKGKTGGAEPIKTLATYRKKNNKILFGINLLWVHQKWNSREQAILKVGDKIDLLSRF